jgi:hypothetical protein
MLKSGHCAGFRRTFDLLQDYIWNDGGGAAEKVNQLVEQLKLPAKLED